MRDSSGDLSPALAVLGGAPPGWADDPVAVRDGLAWLVALPGPPRRELLAEAWPNRFALQLSAACLEPSWGAGASRDPLALASAEAILLGWWCQAETVLVARDLVNEAWDEAPERLDSDPLLMDRELPPAVCFVPALEGTDGYHHAPAVLPGGPPERLVAVLLVRDRPSLVAWDQAVAALFHRVAPGWPGRLSPRVWAAALWAGEGGRLTRSAGPVRGWDGGRWRSGESEGAVGLPRAGHAQSATRLGLALLATVADDPGRLHDLGSEGHQARLAA